MVKEKQLDYIRDSSHERIIEHKDFSCPWLFPAGPGCGKTTVAKRHSIYLRDKGMRILCLSFSNAAVEAIGKIDYIDVYTLDSFMWWALYDYDMVFDINQDNLHEILKRFYKKLRTDSIFRQDIITRYDAVVLDEGQDNTFRQMEVVKEISRSKLHVFADVDQCVYPFRGTTPFVLDGLEYEEEYSFEYTHRLTKQVLNPSLKLIKNNLHRLDYRYSSYKEGEDIYFENTLYSTERCLEIVKDLLNRGVPPSSIAVLSRNLQYGKAKSWWIKDFIHLGLSETARPNTGYIGTIHGCKGLGWSYVFVVRADAHEFGRDINLEESRRLFYVAMTRSSEYLWIGAYCPTFFIEEAGIKERAWNL